MDEQEKAWSKDKIKWVNEKMQSKVHGTTWFKLPTFCPNQKDEYDFWFYLYGTIYDMGEAYKRLSEKEPQKMYWRKKFINNYCRAHNDRLNYIKQNYLRTKNGKKQILFKKTDCKSKIWVDQTKIKQIFKEDSVSC